MGLIDDLEKLKNNHQKLLNNTPYMNGYKKAIFDSIHLIEKCRGEVLDDLSEESCLSNDQLNEVIEIIIQKFGGKNETK